jgi:hypothetical protein
MLLPGHFELALCIPAGQLAAEGAVLQGSKEGVQLNQRNLLTNYNPFNSAYLCRKLSLLTQTQVPQFRFERL